jgi:Uma2 family endonuclease
MATTQRHAVTADELLLYRGDPAKRYELVDGELIEMSAPGGEHGETAFNAGRLIGNFVAPSKLGVVYAAETGFRLRQSPDHVRAPDVAFVRRDRLPEGKSPRGYLPLAPDFVVEVVSPGDTAHEVQDRVDEWLQAGTLIVWVVYSSPKSVYIFRGLDRIERRSGDEELDAEPVLPGFRCKVSGLFGA